MLICSASTVGGFVVNAAIVLLQWNLSAQKMFEIRESTRDDVRNQNF
jgi:hypothetical protein